MNGNSGTSRRFWQQATATYIESLHITMATRVYESRVIPVPIEKVWATIRALDLKWLDTVKSVESTGGAGEVRLIGPGREPVPGREMMISEDQQIALKLVSVAGRQPEESCFQGRNSAGQATGLSWLVT